MSKPKNHKKKKAINVAEKQKEKEQRRRTKKRWLTALVIIACIIPLVGSMFLPFIVM